MCCPLHQEPGNSGTGLSLSNLSASCQSDSAASLTRKDLARQINTQKTKVMAFFETPSPQKARGGQHQPGPTLPPFHIHVPLLTSSPRSYFITEVLEFEYSGLIFSPKLTMHLATTEAIRHAAHGQSVTQAVSYSLRIDKKRFQLTPTQNLDYGSLLYYLISSRICAISRELLMSRNSRLGLASLSCLRSTCLWRSYSLARGHWCPPPYLDAIHPPCPVALSSHKNTAYHPSCYSIQDF